MINFIRKIWHNILSMFYHKCLLCNKKAKIGIELQDTNGRVLEMVYVCDDCIAYIENKFGNVENFFNEVFEYFSEHVYKEKEL